MTGLYFSGTGNTKYCVETFVKEFDDNNTVMPIETFDKNLLETADIIVLGYPVYFSNAPKILQDFIADNSLLFKNKKVFVIATMGLFSGDGTGCAARLLKKYGADVIGGLHLKMPDCIGDNRLLKKTESENEKLVENCRNKIAVAARKLENDQATKEGLSIGSQILGLLGQRLWFYSQTNSYKNKPNIDNAKCIGCGICEEVCPMKNLEVQGKKAVSKNRCTLCYRCFSECPTEAITVLGKVVYTQYSMKEPKQKAPQ